MSICDYHKQAKVVWG